MAKVGKQDNNLLNGLTTTDCNLSMQSQKIAVFHFELGVKHATATEPEIKKANLIICMLMNRKKSV